PYTTLFRSISGCNSGKPERTTSAPTTSRMSITTNAPNATQSEVCHSGPSDIKAPISAATSAMNVMAPNTSPINATPTPAPARIPLAFNWLLSSATLSFNCFGTNRKTVDNKSSSELIRVFVVTFGEPLMVISHYLRTCDAGGSLMLSPTSINRTITLFTSLLVY